jgi:hypothetical protein
MKFDFVISNPPFNAGPTKGNLHLKFLEKVIKVAGKIDPKINFKAFFVDLDEIPEKIDISICLPPKKVPDETKTVPKSKSKSVRLF